MVHNFTCSWQDPRTQRIIFISLPEAAKFLSCYDTFLERDSHEANKRQASMDVEVASNSSPPTREHFIDVVSLHDQTQGLKCSFTCPSHLQIQQFFV